MECTPEEVKKTIYCTSLYIDVINDLGSILKQIPIESEVYEDVSVRIERAINRALDDAGSMSRSNLFIVENHLKILNPKTVLDPTWWEIFGCLEVFSLRVSCTDMLSVSSTDIYWYTVRKIEDEVQDNVLPLYRFTWSIENKPEALGEAHKNLSQFCTEIQHLRREDRTLFSLSPTEMEMVMFQAVWRAVSFVSDRTVVSVAVDEDVDMQVSEVVDESVNREVWRAVSGRMDVVLREDHPSLNEFTDAIRHMRR